MRCWLFALLLVACGGAQRPVPTRDAGARADPPPVPSDRALAAEATFGDLVSAAVHQDDRRASDSEAGCLLRVSPSGFVLDADLSVAVRGLTEAAVDLGERIGAHHGAVRVLTRLGSYGAASPLVAVALTTIAGVPRRTAALLVLTSRGVYVLRTDATTDTTPLDVAHAATSIASLDVASVFVTANADISLGDFAALLRALPASLEGRLAIATMLPDGAQAPDPASTEGADAAPICSGLDELAEDAPIGDLDAATLRTSLSALVPAAEACVATSASGLGGLVRVAFRVEPDGHVRQACVTDDATDDGTLRACIVTAIEAIVFPRPTGGSVDVELPLRLELAHDAAHHQRALCE